MRVIHHKIQPLRPLNAVKLGRFIVSKEEPQQGFKDPACQHPYEPLITLQEDLEQSAGNLSSGLFRTDLSAAADFTQAHDLRQRKELLTPKAKIYQLNNSDLWFKTAIQDAEIREWMEDAIYSTGKIYMIVGFMTVHDAAVAQGQFDRKEKGGSVHAPVGESVAAAVMIPVPMAPSMADPGLELRRMRESFAQQTLTAPGEQVAKIQLRKLKFKFLSSRDVKDAKLEGKSQWRSSSKFRGLAPDVNDIMDARLEDSGDSDSDSDED